LGPDLDGIGIKIREGKSGHDIMFSMLSLFPLASDNTYEYVILNFSSTCLIHFNITLGKMLLGPFLLIKTI